MKNAKNNAEKILSIIMKIKTIMRNRVHRKKIYTKT